MEMLDGSCSFEGKNMPEYTTILKYLVLLLWLCIFGWVDEIWFMVYLQFDLQSLWHSWCTNGSCMKIIVAVKLYYLLWT